MKETEYTPVADGFHDCKIAFARRAEKHYGKEIGPHIVLELYLEPTDADGIENVARYRAELPLILVPGFEWDFYNAETKKGEWRKVTAADTKAALEYAQKCFPKWKEVCETLADGNEDIAFGWFSNAAETEGMTVRAKLRRGADYTGSDGDAHMRLDAKIYPPFEARPVVADSEKRQIANALKAAGVKLFGAKKAATPVAATAPAAPAANAPKPPASATGKTLAQAKDEAVAAYLAAHPEDSGCLNFYAETATALKIDLATWESWGVAEWERAAAAFKAEF